MGPEQDAETFRGQAVVVSISRPWLLWPASILVVLLPTLLRHLLVEGAYGFAPLLAYVALIVLFGVYGQRAHRLRGRVISVRGGDVFLGDRCVAARESLRGLYSRRSAASARVSIDLAASTLNIAFEEAETAAVFVEGIRSDRIDYRVVDASRLHAMAVILTVVLVVASYAASYSWDFPMYREVSSVCSLAAMAAELSRSRVLSVGADGVELRSWLGRARFVSFRDVVRVELRDDVIFLVLKGRPSICLRGNYESEEAGDRGREIADAIRARAAKYGAGDVEARLPPIPEHADPARSFAEVISRSDSRAGFRRASVPPSVLWQVVEQASAPAPVRFEAALALRAELDEADRTRLRGVADSCAATALRSALLTIASGGGDATLRATLSSVPL